MFGFFITIIQKTTLKNFQFHLKRTPMPEPPTNPHPQKTRKTRCYWIVYSISSTLSQKCVFWWNCDINHKTMFFCWYVCTLLKIFVQLPLRNFQSSWSSHSCWSVEFWRSPPADLSNLEVKGEKGKRPSADTSPRGTERWYCWWKKSQTTTWDVLETL